MTSATPAAAPLSDEPAPPRGAPVSDGASSSAASSALAPSTKKPRRPAVLGALTALAVMGGVGLWLHGRGRESTDNAQIDAEVVSIPARVGGTVAKVLFAENQTVKAGDLLALLDDEPAKAKVAQAEASLEAAEAQAQAAEADARVTATNATGNKAVAEASYRTVREGAVTAGSQIKEAEAALRSAEAQAKQAEEDRERTRKLFESGAAPKATYDQAETAYALATSSLEAARAHLLVLKSNVVQTQSRIAEASAKVLQSSEVAAVVTQAQARARAARAQAAMAKALLDLAKLDLSYTRIVAPHDGVVSKKSISVGQALSPGQPIVQLVTPGVWITANFKETQLPSMHVGQRAEASIDAFPGVTLHGEVESFSGATGSRFTLLPPDNASGNFTKVVQRLPVRIKLVDVPDGVVLRPGMSVELTVFTRS